VFKQLEQNMIRLILQLQLDPITTQLSGVRFQFKYAKAIKGMNFGGQRHDPSPHG
jgi:hypothetical protein